MHSISYRQHYAIRDACHVLEACARLVETSEHSFRAARDDLADRLRSVAWHVSQVAGEQGGADEDVAEWLTALLRVLATGDEFLDHQARIALTAPISDDEFLREELAVAERV